MANPAQENLELKRQIEDLKAQLASKTKDLKFEFNEPRAAGTKGASDQGCIGGNWSIRGLGRFPLTAYHEQWRRIFAPEFVEMARKELDSPLAIQRAKQYAKVSK
jgi:hypothetical protein